MQKRQLGIGLLELMLSLAIIAILLVMATRYYLTASQSSDVNEVISNIQGVTGCFAKWRQDYLGGQSTQDFSRFRLQTCDQYGWFPKANASGENLVTPWGLAPINPSSDDIQITITPKTDAETRSLALKLGADPNNIPSAPLKYSIVQQTLVTQ